MRVLRENDAGNYDEVQSIEAASSILDVTLSEDADTLAIGSMGPKFKIYEFDHATGLYNQKWSIIGPGSQANYARSLSLNSNGSLLAVGFDDFSIRIYQRGECENGDINENNECITQSGSLVIWIVIGIVALLMIAVLAGFLIFRKIRKSMT